MESRPCCWEIIDDLIEIYFKTVLSFEWIGLSKCGTGTSTETFGIGTVLAPVPKLLGTCTSTGKLSVLEFRYWIFGTSFGVSIEWKSFGTSSKFTYFWSKITDFQTQFGNLRPK